MRDGGEEVKRRGGEEETRGGRKDVRKGNRSGNPSVTWTANLLVNCSLPRWWREEHICCRRCICSSVHGANERRSNDPITESKNDKCRLIDGGRVCSGTSQSESCCGCRHEQKKSRVCLWLTGMKPLSSSSAPLRLKSSTCWLFVFLQTNVCLLSVINN